jgi:hypothetical protein
MSADMNDFEFFDRALRSSFKRLTHDRSDLLPLSAYRFGLLTHNAQWGADAYAHAYGHNDPAKPYPADRLHQLSEATGLSMQDAEDVFEMTMEYAICASSGAELGSLLRECADAVGDREEQALIGAYAEPLMERVPGLTKERAVESIRRMFRCYRIFLRNYGSLMHYDEAQLRGMVPRMFTLAFGFSRERAEQCFTCAIALCADWQQQLDAIAVRIKADCERQYNARSLQGFRDIGLPALFFLGLRAVF